VGHTVLENDRLIVDGTHSVVVVHDFSETPTTSDPDNLEYVIGEGMDVEIIDVDSADLGNGYEITDEDDEDEEEEEEDGDDGYPSTTA
jgi:hypothetical protein